MMLEVNSPVFVTFFASNILDFSIDLELLRINNNM